jgi:AsmA protein
MEELSDINMTLSLPNMDNPFGAEGSLAWHGELVTLIIEGDQLRSLVEGDATPLKMSLESAPLNLGYEGRVIAGEVPKVVGRVDLNVPSIRELATWTGNSIETGGGGFNLLTIKGQVTVTGPEYAFTNAEIALDNMFATGDFSADTGGAKLYAKGRLDIDQLDLNTYLPPERASDAEEEAALDEGLKWSKEPIDLSGLAGVNADFDLSVGAIKVRDIKVDRSALSVSLKDGVLVTDLTELKLYGGQGQGRIELDGSGSVPSVENSFSLKGVRANPLLTDAAKFTNLEGTGDFEIAITAQGISQDAMVKSLNGKGNVKFSDGAITGFNLASMARNVKSAFQNPKADRTQKTDFAELSGTFSIKGGIVSNKDLLLLNPLLRAKGSGTANMPKRTLDYRIEPKLVGSIEGQGGDADEGGVTIPVLVKGPWHALRFQPDVEGVVSDVLKDPGKALKDVEGTVKKLKKGSKKIDAKKELKKLLGD